MVYILTLWMAVSGGFSGQWVVLPGGWIVSGRGTRRRLRLVLWVGLARWRFRCERGAGRGLRNPVMGVRERVCGVILAVCVGIGDFDGDWVGGGGSDWGGGC